jgi:glycosyltransferase involved in cell wall biosynthesis
MPSFNQAPFLERAILSVLNQDYPNTELIVLDGGSRDGSVEIIQRYARYLAFWRSEPDGGQAAALNRGLAMATGELVGWQNSDDLYLPDAFTTVVEAMRAFPQTDLIIGDNFLIDEQDEIREEVTYLPFNLDYLMFLGWNLSSQATFWRHDLTPRVGTMREELRVGFDYDWFIRLGKVATHPVLIPAPLAAYRIHPMSKFSTIPAETRWPLEAAILQAHGVRTRADIPWRRQYRWKKLRVWLSWRILYALLRGRRLRRWRHLWLPWWESRGLVFSGAKRAARSQALGHPTST